MTQPLDRAEGKASLLTADQRRRYSRQIMLREIGEDGQLKLLAGRVLVVGAGGLGSPVALYLAAAGVGTIGIVDSDVVDLSNLQRQVLHHTHDLGRSKALSARETLGELNPDAKVIPYPLALEEGNVTEILSDYDVIVTACDNFATRYLLNDACVALDKPLVEGSVFRFEGQATVFLPGQGCYRCLFPTPPPGDLLPKPQTVGVLGVVPGIIGVIQACEAIKLILGVGQSLAGRLLLLDALTMDLRQVRLRRNPRCPVCGKETTED